MSGPSSFLAVLLLCLAEAAYGSAGHGRLVRSEAQRGTISAVIRPDGAVAGRGHAAAVDPKVEDADHAELTEDPGTEDPHDAELEEDPWAEELFAEDGLEGPSRSAAGAVPVCASKEGDKCSCQGIMAVIKSSDRVYIRVDGNETCSNPSDTSPRRRRSQFITGLSTYCLCFSMDICTNISKVTNKTVDPAHRRRTAPPESAHRRRRSSDSQTDEEEESLGNGFAQRRRWCGFGNPEVNDCMWADWGDWSECQVAENKNEGIHLRTRSVNVSASGGGKQCKGDYEDMKDCTRRSLSYSSRSRSSSSRSSRKWGWR